MQASIKYHLEPTPTANTLVPHNYPKSGFSPGIKYTDPDWVSLI